MLRAIVLASCLLAVACDDLGGPWIGGIGAVLRHRARDSTLLVQDVPPRGTAAAAGLRQGDRVIAIDGTRVADMEPSAIVERLRGPVGSRVRLTIARGATTRVVVVERAPYSARD
jgi:carboxyl-terminal processing protease